MTSSKNDNSTKVNHDWTKARKVNAQISLKDLMVKELSSSLEDGDMRKMPVRIHSTPHQSVGLIIPLMTMRNSIAYVSESADNDKSSNSSIVREENI